MHWKHDWEVQPRLPIKYEQDKFDEVFQETGIAVLQFAKGEELKKFQDEAIDRATRLPKITIHNETEVIESETTTAELGEVTHPWTTVALDCARMQAYLPKGESMPGTAFIAVFSTNASCDEQVEKGAGRARSSYMPACRCARATVALGFQTERLV